MKKVVFAVFVILSTVCGGQILQPSMVYADTSGCPDQIMGITTWYKGLHKEGKDGNCEIIGPGQEKDGNGANLTNFIMKIVLNCIAAALGVVAYVTIFFIIVGGFRYMTSAGSPEGMQKAKKSITNAVIGLVIAILSASIVNAIGGLIK